jgi:hypothetical protein
LQERYISALPCSTGWLRANIIGGIYSRPVAIGNVANFTIGALGLLKSMFAGEHDLSVIVGSAAYAAFAILFAFVAFWHSPTKRVET